MDAAQILTRDFQKATGLRVINVKFTKDETIRVTTCDGRVWVMTIGSDDDKFFFRTESDFGIGFEFSPEWLALIQE